MRQIAAQKNELSNFHGNALNNDNFPCMMEKIRIFRAYQIGFGTRLK